MKSKTLVSGIGALTVAGALALAPLMPASGYSPTGGVMYQLPSDASCLKGIAGCVSYPKAAQLPNGRLVASFEKSTVPASGTAIGQTMPIYESDDNGNSWQPLSEVKAPAFLSNDPAYAKYTSNWTNGYFYVLPQDVGNLKKGTLLLATVVTGEDDYYTDQKAANPNWVPTNDGDRQDMAIALYSSTDSGTSWNIVNIVATGGWQGGSAGAIGKDIAKANSTRQVDPLWEPYVMVYNNQLVTYYSDEDDYIGYDPTTGVAQLDPNNDSAPDSQGQILVHRTWDGASPAWSAPVVDVSGTTVDMGNGKTEIGGGRPGMTNVAKMSDGKWMITFEYFGGGDHIHYKISDSPLTFFADNTPAGNSISALPVASGSHVLSNGNAPVIDTLPDGRILYNATGSASIWVNQSGRSDGVWTEFQSPMGAAATRTIQYVSGTGQIEMMRGQSPSAVGFAQVDLGNSEGAYYQLVNQKSGQVLGTGGQVNDANLGNKNVPDVVTENPGSVTNSDTEYWHVVTKSDGNITLLNKSGGRAATVWTGNATIGQKVAQWVDNQAGGSWKFISNPDGTVKLQAATNAAAFVTAAATGGQVTLQRTVADGSQDWRLVPLAPVVADLTPARQSTALVGEAPVGPGGTLVLDASASDPSGAALHANVTGHAYLFGGSGAATDLGAVSFDAAQHGSVTLPAEVPPTYQVAVLFDGSPLLWDNGTAGKGSATVTASAPSVPWGTAATVTVDVSADSAAVTGQVALTEGSTDRGIATLQDGKATFTLPVGVAGGDHTLTATYSGNDQLNAASAQVTMTVVLPTAWSKTATYQAGDTVSFNGQVYQAGWYSKGEQPGASNTGAWQQIAITEDGSTVWTASRAFIAGQTVVYQGKTFKADWWTRGEAPGSTTGPWEEIASAPNGIALWTPSRVFNAGDQAVYNGVTYIAKWYSRNKVPGTPNSPWTTGN